MVGHSKCKNLSLSERSLKFGIREEIFPKIQFLSILNLGHWIRKWNSVSICGVVWDEGGSVNGGDVVHNDGSLADGISVGEQGLQH